MTTKIQHGDGIYSRMSKRTIAGKPIETFYGRVYIAEEKRSRYFKLGRTLKAARRKMVRITDDVDAAVRERQRVADRVRDGLTVEALHRDFTANYRGRGGTDFYINVLKRMIACIGKVPARDVTAATLDSYLRRRRTEKTKGVPRIVDGKRVMVGAGQRLVGESTLRKECIVVAKMFKWAKVRGKVAVNPFAEYEKPRDPGGSPARALTYAEEDAMLAAMPPLERDVVIWGLDSGMRRSEFLFLEWPRIEQATGLIHVVKTKTGKNRTVPLALSARLSAILKRHPQRTDTPLLFHDREGKPLDVDRLNGILESAMRKAGVPKIRGSLWNVLRKTWVSRIYASGKVLPQDEADWAGHGIEVAMKHYREHSPAARAVADGLLDRPKTGAGAVARTDGEGLDPKV